MFRVLAGSCGGYNTPITRGRPSRTWTTLGPTQEGPRYLLQFDLRFKVEVSFSVRTVCEPMHGRYSQGDGVYIVTFFAIPS